MKKSVKRAGISFLLLFSLIFLASCSAKNVDNASSALYDTMAYGNIEKMALDMAEMENFEFNTEEYSEIEENGYKSVVDYPVSTFSADVDTASYSNLRRMILDGSRDFDIGAVRIEEMLNYFSYDYPEPEGDVPFSVTTEYSYCPWNEDVRLLKIGLQAEKLDSSQLPPSNLVFLIDVSGSMNSPDKLPLVQSAFGLLTENLDENDRISIVTYAGSDSVVLEGADGSEKVKISDAVNSLEAFGSTQGSAGIITAYEIAERYFIEGGNNRVILATDGDFNVGTTSEAELKKLIEQKRENGVCLSVLGFGTGNIKDNKMETLADNGNGNYYYIDSIIEAKKVLIEEMGGTLFTVAKDVKLQIEFNPEFVKGYRLIGYENRLLNTEDFDDDTKDAGDIGAGHRVTALYEIVETGSDMEIPETDLKYQSDKTTTGSDELLTLSLRYKEPDSDTSKLLEYPVLAESYSDDMSDDMKFAACVAEFGMLLRDSKYINGISYANIADDLSKLPQVTEDEYKTELLYLVNLMSK